MRNRALHDALRDFALEAAALLSDDVRDGAQLEFDVVDDGAGRGPALYRYSSRTDAFLRERWPRLRELPACAGAAEELGAGASAWLRVNGLRGEQAEPALQAMLERLYEDATSFGLPEERFERVYAEVEATLYRDVVRTQVLVPLAGVAIEAARVELGDGLSLVRGDRIDAPPEAVWPEDGPGEPAVLCVLERDFPADEQPTAAWAEERFRGLVTSLRLFKAGAVGLGAPGWRRTGDGRFAPLSMGGPVRARGGPWVLLGGEEVDLREFVAALDGTAASGPVGWALARFEMGCERELDPEALSDYLLALRGAVGGHDRGRRGEPGAPSGSPLRRGRRAPGGTAPDGGRPRARALPDGRWRQPAGKDRVGVPRSSSRSWSDTCEHSCGMCSAAISTRT